MNDYDDNDAFIHRLWIIMDDKMNDDAFIHLLNMYNDIDGEL